MTDSERMLMKETADRLDEHVKIRAVPRPPVFVSNAGDPVALPELIMRDVAPHWNQMVRQLGPDGSNMTTLQVTAEQLRQQVERINVEIASLERDLMTLEEILAVIEAEAAKHGWDTPVGSALGHAPNRQPANVWWQWESLNGHAYQIEVPANGSEWLPSADTLALFLKVHHGEKWEAAHDRVASRADKTLESLEPLEKRRALCDFRLLVVEQIVLEHTVLGYVGPLDADALRRRRFLPPDISRFKRNDLLFIVAAAGAIGADPQRTKKRTILLEEVADTVERFLRQQGMNDRWYQEKARRIAEGRHIEAYQVKAGKSGRLGEELEREERKRFDNAVLRVAKELGEAGVKTMQDTLNR